MLYYQIIYNECFITKLPTNELEFEPLINIQTTALPARILKRKYFLNYTVEFSTIHSICILGFIPYSLGLVTTSPYS